MILIDRIPIRSAESLQSCIDGLKRVAEQEVRQAKSSKEPLKAAEEGYATFMSRSIGEARTYLQRLQEGPIHSDGHRFIMLPPEKRRALGEAQRFLEEYWECSSRYLDYLSRTAAVMAAREDHDHCLH